jgi:hypothetical protein
MERRQVVGTTGRANRWVMVTDCEMSSRQYEMAVVQVGHHIRPGI